MTAVTAPEKVWAEACEAATVAWKATEPTPIVVYTPKGLFDDTPDLEKPVYHHSEGVCGFGWIVIEDGRTSFARWLKKHDIGNQSAYYGGRVVWSSYLVPEDRASQSLARKEAAVRAAVEVLRKAGIQAHAMSRMD